MSGSTSESLCCRICLEEGERIDFIAPCACSGSSKWVHRHCLDRWRSTREDKAFSRCTECLKLYKMVHPSGIDEEEVSCGRRFRFFGLVARDYLVAIVFSQIIIAVLAGIVFSFDRHSQALIGMAHMSSQPVLFYYLVGLLSSLSLLGMWFTVHQIGCCGESSRSRRGHSGCTASDCYCGDVYFYPWVYSSPQTTAVDCCCCHPECCTVCGQGAADGAGGAVAGGCGDCGSAVAGGAAGEECMMCFLAVVVVFALVGVVVCVVVGAAYAQQVVRQHYHVLQKYTLTAEFIVADLAEGALPLGDRGMGAGAAEVVPVSELEGAEEGRGREGRWWGSRQAAGAGTNAGRAPHQLYSRVPTAPLQGEEGQPGPALEMAPLVSHSPLIVPSAPPADPSGDHLAAPAGAAEMDRNAIYAGASAPYDPTLHAFSFAQYQHLTSRGLL